MEKGFIVIERSEYMEEVTEKATAKEAVEFAKMLWDHLTKEEKAKKRVIACYVEYTLDMVEEVKSLCYLEEDSEIMPMYQFANVFNVYWDSFEVEKCKRLEN